MTWSGLAWPGPKVPATGVRAESPWQLAQDMPMTSARPLTWTVTLTMQPARLPEVQS